MATKKTAAQYRVLRPWDGHEAGELIELDPDAAALLIRDGIVALTEE